MSSLLVPIQPVTDAILADAMADLSFYTLPSPQTVRRLTILLAFRYHWATTQGAFQVLKVSRVDKRGK